MSKQTRVILLIALLLIAGVIAIVVGLSLMRSIAASTSGDLFSGTLSNSSEVAHVDWLPINPPPGEEGPCYYFQRKEYLGAYLGFGFSGVWCK